ncbi:MAG: hypothetical protein R2712_16900 [Vicinamibacterales bacterium]
MDFDNLVSFRLSPALSGTTTPAATAIAGPGPTASPGVKVAAMAADPSSPATSGTTPCPVEGHQAKDGEDMQAFMNAVSPAYFETMGIALLEGGDFARQPPAENSTVAIVNRRFAEHFFPGQSAVGPHLGNGSGPGTKLTIEIIGVVDNVYAKGPREGIRHRCTAQLGLEARCSTSDQTASSSAFALLRNEVKTIDAAMPVYQMKTLENQLDETLLTDRLIASLSGGFRPVGHGHLRRDGFRRDAAQQGDGHPRRSAPRPGSVIWMVKEVLVLPQRRTRRGRTRQASRAGPVRGLAALRHRTPRPVDGHDDRRLARHRLRGRGLIPARRQPASTRFWRCGTSRGVGLGTWGDGGVTLPGYSPFRP